MKLLKSLRGFIRCRIFHFCPQCNSDAPQKYDCTICGNFYGYPSRNLCRVWWDKFIKRQNN